MKSNKNDYIDLTLVESSKNSEGLSMQLFLNSFWLKLNFTKFRRQLNISTPIKYNVHVHESECYMNAVRHLKGTNVYI